MIASMRKTIVKSGTRITENGFVIPDDNQTKTPAKGKWLLEVQEKQKIKEKSWYIFVLSFLVNAKNGCDFLINSKKLDGNSYLIISVIFNLKHGLELFCKAFTRFINIKIDKSDHGHDVRMLFQTLKEKLNSNQKYKESLSKEVNELERIVEKYNEMNFLRSYLKENFSLFDKENEFFKYAEHSVEIKVDYSSLINKISKLDIREIKNDIESVIKISKKFKNILS